MFIYILCCCFITAELYGAKRRRWRVDVTRGASDGVYAIMLFPAIIAAAAITPRHDDY